MGIWCIEAGPASSLDDANSVRVGNFSLSGLAVDFQQLVWVSPDKFPFPREGTFRVFLIYLLAASDHG